MTWQVGLALGVALAIAYAALKVLDAVERLNKQIENVRYYLGEIDARQQRMADHMTSVEYNVRRHAAGKPHGDWLSELGHPDN